MRELEGLNPEQREAVTHGTGPLLVLAGAGSGKTRVLTHRLAWLLHQGMAAPHQITAVTFTNKAAREMAERVGRLLGRPAPGLFVGTFHRWALDVLRRWPERAGLPERFSILDVDEQRALVAEAAREEGVDERAFPARALLAAISAAANAGRRPGEDDRLDRVWRRYRTLKRAAGAVDFDDMLVLALELLRRDDEVRAAVSARCRFLLVDEFQDTNRLQLELLLAVLDGERNLTAVGDEDQSIYRWRGAELDNILAFERHFPGARVVKLERNYRSTAPILAAAGALIARNLGRRGKRLFTDREGGEPVRLFVAPDDRAEARWVADRVEELAHRFGPGEVAVLMRTNAQSRPFEEELTRRHVPYRVVGGLRFWQRAMVKNALAYLRLAANPDDAMAFRRVVNVPARGIGAATLDLLTRHARARGIPLPAASRELPEGLTARARKALEEFWRLLDEARARFATDPPGDLAAWLIEASGLLALAEGNDPERLAARENLEALVGAVREATAQGQDLAAFLDSVALLEEGDEAAPRDAVSLMTLHAAKGLEFDAVLLVGLERGFLPHASALEDPEEIEEERRLAYVGMTRARRWLALTAARTRYLYGARKERELSPFLEEIGGEHLADVSYPAPSAAVSTTPGAGGTSRRAARAPARRAPARRGGATAADALGRTWSPGDRVRHRRFGQGIVLACQGSGERLKLVVFFDRAGKKTLVPTVAPIERA